jgi:hypothetical protein
MILGFQWPVSYHHRAEMMESHEGKTQEQFLDAIWSNRDGGYYVRHGFPIVRGDWPVRRSDELPLPNVSKLRKRA